MRVLLFCSTSERLLFCITLGSETKNGIIAQRSSGDGNGSPNRAAVLLTALLVTVGYSCFQQTVTDTHSVTERSIAWSGDEKNTILTSTQGRAGRVHELGRVDPSRLMLHTSHQPEPLCYPK